METYPSIFPRPTLSFNGDTEVATVETKMDSGRIRSRNRSTRQIDKYNATWEMTDFQFGMFKAWFKHLISNGADFFYIDLPVGGSGFQTNIAKFSKSRYSFSNKGVLDWNVSAVLILENATIFSLDEYTALLEMGDLDAFEAAVAHLTEYVST